MTLVEKGPQKKDYSAIQYGLYGNTYLPYTQEGAECAYLWGVPGRDGAHDRLEQEERVDGEEDAELQLSVRLQEPGIVGVTVVGLAAAVTVKAQELHKKQTNKYFKFFRSRLF